MRIDRKEHRALNDFVGADATERGPAHEGAPGNDLNPCDACERRYRTDSQRDNQCKDQGN